MSNLRMGTCATNHGIKKNTPNHGKKNHPVVKRTK
jgi:hypothetical protein